MTTLHKKPFFIRFFLITVYFLWAFMLLGQEVAACAIVQEQESAREVLADEEVASDNTHGLLLLQGSQFFAESGTLSFSNFSLQQAVVPGRAHYFRNPSDEAIPPYAARAPGLNFFIQFFLTSITPHAP